VLASAAVHGKKSFIVTELLSRPSHFVLPCIKEIARGTKLILMVFPNVFADIDDSAGSPEISQRLDYPWLKVAAVSHLWLLS